MSKFSSDNTDPSPSSAEMTLKPGSLPHLDLPFVNVLQHPRVFLVFSASKFLARKMRRFLSPTATARTRDAGFSRLRNTPRALSTPQDVRGTSGVHARMWNWDHPDDLVCPGDPNTAWYIVNADGLLFPRTQSEIQAFDFSVFSRVEITHNPSWRDAVGFYRSYYHARRRRHELSSFDLDLGFPLSSPYHSAASSPLTPASESGTVSPLRAESEEPTQGDHAPHLPSLPTAEEDRQLDPLSLATQSWSDVRVRGQSWGDGELRPIENAFWSTNTATIREVIASGELERAREGSSSPETSLPTRPRSFRELDMESESEEGGSPSDRATDGSASRSSSQEADSGSDAEMDNQERERRRAAKSKSRKRCNEDEDVEEDGNDDDDDDDHDDDDNDFHSWDEDDKKRYLIPVKAKEFKRDDMIKVIKKVKLRSGKAATKIVCWRPKANVMFHDSESEGPSSYGAGPSYPRPSPSQSPARPSTSPSPAPQQGSSSRSSTPTPGSSSQAATSPPDSSSRSPTPVPQPSSSAAAVAGPSDAAPPSPASSAASSTDGMFEDYSPKEIALIDVILKRLT
ncbi:hypothetical protein CVT26_006113 [Gymnopilus dilepis]|uniref:Uncharacterized protein n=1 Tax=Gymnopilus dilepis TaxID=231916 RepID=A0A409WGF2_9AGAR|nr:hypothetical protein CVT26_006113 [Gymnopilus dilepis]